MNDTQTMASLYILIGVLSACALMPIVEDKYKPTIVFLSLFWPIFWFVILVIATVRLLKVK